MQKRRTTVYIDKKVWGNFMKYIVEEYGKTHGGVILAEEVDTAIKPLIKSRN